MKNIYFFLANVLLCISMISHTDNGALARPKTPWHAFDFELTKPESQREAWQTGLVAEPIATYTNAGFFGVAYAHRKTAPLSAIALTAAGLASAISHAIPYNVLNIIDKIAAAMSVAAVAYDSKLYKPEVLKENLKNPLLTSLLLATGATYILDIFIPRSGWERKPEHAYLHGLWHILAATLAHTTLQLNQSQQPR